MICRCVDEESLENPGQHLFFKSTFNLVPVLMFDNGNLVQETTLRHSFQNKLHCWLRIPDWYVLSPKHRSQTNSPPIIHELEDHLIISHHYNTRLSFHIIPLFSASIPLLSHIIPMIFPLYSHICLVTMKNLRRPGSRLPQIPRIRLLKLGSATLKRTAAKQHHIEEPRVWASRFVPQEDSHNPLRLGCLGG